MTRLYLIFLGAVLFLAVNSFMASIGSPHAVWVMNSLGLAY